MSAAHELDIERTSSGALWAWCSCGDWSLHAARSIPAVREAHEAHLERLADAHAASSLGWAPWDDDTDDFDDDLDDGEQTLTLEEYLACR